MNVKNLIGMWNQKVAEDNGKPLKKNDQSKQKQIVPKILETKTVQEVKKIEEIKKVEELKKVDEGKVSEQRVEEVMKSDDLERSGIKGEVIEVGQNGDVLRVAKNGDIKLGYWGIRGRAQPIRLMLSYCGIEYENVLYNNPNKWFGQDKNNLGLDFPNLPYLIDGHYNLTESTAILKYIIQKSAKLQLLGKNIQDNARLQSFLSVFIEFTDAVKKLFFNKNYQTEKKLVLQKYEIFVDQLQRFVGEKEFVLGYLTLGDFLVAEDSYYIEKLFPSEYKRWPFLQRIRVNFEAMSETKAYYKKDDAFKGTFLNAMAQLQVE